tara:strand:- start:187 stop:411 length:225 start_codon:yes stop_codon:yes gene_type:complete
MKELLKLLQSPHLISIKGMTSELGYKTVRTKLKSLSDCEDWIRNNPYNSIRLIFDNDNETIDYFGGNEFYINNT